jgi:L-ascorbate metabolism protein UlaG (beta-lactamase superfamily)
MEITYLGHSSFRIRGKIATVVTDPFDPQVVGLKLPKHVEADIVTISHEHKDHNYTSGINGSPFVVRGPGEYEIMGIGIVGLSMFHDAKKGAERGKNTVYRLEVDGVSIVHMGDLGHILSSEQVDEIDGVDIVMIPVGGKHTINAVQAVSIINEIEPSIVIPMHYDRPGLNKEYCGGLAPIADFLKEFGKDDSVPQSKLIITKDKLPAETQVVILE